MKFFLRVMRFLNFDLTIKFVKINYKVLFFSDISI